MSDEPASTPEPAAPSSHSEGEPRDRSQRPWAGRFFDWLLLRSEIARAAQVAGEFTPQRAEFLQRAKLAFELAELARRDHLQAGSDSALAMELFRQSTYWALRVQHVASEETDPASVWLAGERNLLAGVDASSPEIAELRSNWSADFVALAQTAPERQRSLTELLARYATRALDDAQRPRWRLEWLKLKRVAHVLLVLLPVALVVAGAFLWPERNLARGVPWQTSSSEFECHPEKSECGGAVTDIFFHTKLEESPWLEYDFGKPTAFSGVKIRNRSDYRPELAVPLVVEASDDHKSYRELARRTEVFSIWRARFATEHARYLRVRALNKTWLHLEEVRVLP